MSTLIVKSSQRDSGSSSSFRITPFNFLEGKYQLKMVALPLTNYNVSSRNNVFVFTDDSKLRTATITPGNYDVSTLPAALKSAMETANGSFQSYTIAYSSTTGRLTISASGNFQINASNPSHSAGKLTGFTSDTSSANTHTSNENINLCPSIAIHIRISTEREMVDTKENWSTLFVPITGNQGTWLYYSPPDTFEQYINFYTPVRTLEVSLHDDAMDPIDLNGGEWLFILEKCGGKIQA